jgi:putative ABC transport system permease protein
MVLSLVDDRARHGYEISKLIESISEGALTFNVASAIGATPSAVLATILRSGMTLVAAGVAVGLTVTLASATLLDKLLFGVSPRDPVVYTVVALVVLTTGASRMLRTH